MTTAKKNSSNVRVMGRLVALALEVPPVAYIVITGQVPLWVRIWMGVWLMVWLLSTVVLAATAQKTD